MAPLIVCGVIILAISGCTLQTPPAGGWTSSTYPGKADTLATAPPQTQVHADTAKTAVAEKQATLAEPAVADQQTAPAKPSVKPMPSAPATAQNQTAAAAQPTQANPANTVTPAQAKTQTAIQPQPAVQKPAVAEKPSASQKPASTQKSVSAEKQTTAPTQSSPAASSSGERGPHNPFLNLNRQQPSAKADSAVLVSSNASLPSAREGTNPAPDTTAAADPTQSQPAQTPTSSTAAGKQAGDE